MLICSKNPLFPIDLGAENRIKNRTLFSPKSRIFCSQQQTPKNTMREYSRRRALNPIIISPDDKISLISKQSGEKSILDGKKGFLHQEMMILCALGYYVNGFRGFPWLALNFHMANNLNMHPSTLQLVQNSSNLPMVAKPFYGILSDALYIGGAHRIPYVSVGVILQALSWGSLALIPTASKNFVPLMACVLLSNFGASIAEVAKDALIAEYGQYNKVPGLQSYAVMASAVGGVLGNLLGGVFLLKTQKTKSVFLAFAAILVLQLTVCLKTSEESLGLPQPSNYTLVRESIPQIIKKQYSDLMVAIKEESVSRSLIWVVSSILLIPILSGSMFCYQTQCLNLDPAVIGMSKVTGQLMLLSLTVLYDRFGKNIPMRNLASIVQISYAFSLLLDLVLVKQINIQLGISNEVFALCFSGLAEVIAQFKLLPFYIMFASLAPQGCEGSLMSFLASALCLSSILGGFLGVGLASCLGITSGDYSNLPLGIVIQFFAALLPLRWIEYVPSSQDLTEKTRKKGRSKRTRRNRRVGRFSYDSEYSYRRERESD
ncbi:Major facilitator superfamily protein [Perilla frutescens var. hirtella]|uniref:Major facilitator superfamily protein n=1 Tax=Perilla frutescens var. hirtella TaxID=608512 RepID=A0AAD4ITE4_PERFH|nr:Major facilitator superfamily protein [Perilla frutescens var. frutescens]KAH6820924.1 Major facilitator superfamily protein [Perilla frutescens var. hirtella]